jgi:hypothetical protein
MKLRLLLVLLFSTAILHAEAEASSKQANAAEKARKDAELVKRQCRSIHLGYQTPKAKAAYLEVVPEKSAPGTYFCALGFDMGYFGIQELGDGKKIAIFSVWEPGDPFDFKAHPDQIPEDKRVGMLEKGEGVIAGRFGGEGTGGQSKLPFDWEAGMPTKFFVQAKPVGGFTEFTAHIFDPFQNKWQLMATFRTHSKGIPLQGLYSFVEDFRRNYESAKIVHRASYGNGWLLDLEGKWQPMLNARFTGDVTPSTNIDAGPIPGGFFLQTGGDTENKTTKLWQVITREAKGERPDGLEMLIRP